ncbi:hypothetical protein KA025_01595 [Candidatus Saccharibacteria bacterium]|nr:hypothetical protein [Candidatus Saccharibacteria bacterium]
MSGSVKGGKLAAKTNKKRYGRNFYAEIGAKGGKNSNTGGFAHSLLCDCDYSEDLHKKAQCAGSRGGKVSKRVSVKRGSRYA